MQVSLPIHQRNRCLPTNGIIFCVSHLLFGECSEKFADPLRGNWDRKPSGNIGSCRRHTYNMNIGTAPYLHYGSCRTLASYEHTFLPIPIVNKE